MEIEKNLINPNNFFFSNGFLGIPVYYIENNGGISLEHTHPLQTYIMSQDRNKIIKGLKENAKRSLVDKLKNNRVVKFLRNKFSINPIFIDTSKINSSGIISDSFIWRTDSGFETVFKFSDMPKIFLQKK